ncbi:MAG: methyl-accepting chemotaxis protein [Pseudazoarcus pumilus]|nr:methyl-accepting chemotaxis protein [Pseudazoarcus pumilus]
MSQASLQTRFVAPVSIFVVVVVLGGALLFSIFEDRRIRSEIGEAAAQVSAQVGDTLGVTDALVMEQTRSAMRLLIHRGTALGPAALGDPVSVRERTVPDLLLGDTPQANRFELVDDVVSVVGGTATLFSAEGSDFVRVSTNVMRQGERAIGTVLDPKGRAIAAIRDGRAFYGLVDILGNPFLTGYEPIRDASGAVIGIWYVGYKVDMETLDRTIRGIRLLDSGFMALLDQTGKLRFHSEHVDAERIQAVLADQAGWVVTSRPFTQWGFQIVTAYPDDEVTAISRGRSITIVLVGVAACALLIGMLVWLLRRLVLRPLGGEPDQAIAAANRIAEGDLVSSIELRDGDAHSMMAAIRGMQTRLREIVRDINAGATSLASAADKLVEVSGEVSDGVERQNEATSSIAATLQEITVSIGHVSDNAGVASEMAGNASGLAGDGRSVVGAAVAEMQATASSVNATAEVIRALGEASEQISRIVGVIGDVASQTNLLALNAAIEAAGAGESGRGFAVVADEVRKLAERTSVSTKEISEMIERIQHETEQAVAGIDAGATRASACVEKATVAGDSMERILEAAHSVVGAIGEISMALKEQSSASDNIARSVQQVAQMNEENTSAVHAVRHDAEALRALATRLQASVGSFRV